MIGDKVEVGVKELRENLATVLRLVREGRSFVVTDRGRPVARLQPASDISVLERLIAEGKVRPAEEPRRRLKAPKPVKARGSVSEYVIKHRR